MAQAAQSTLIPLHTHQRISDLHSSVCLLFHYNQMAAVTIKTSVDCTVLCQRISGIRMQSCKYLLKCLDGTLLQDENNSGFLRVDSRAFIFNPLWDQSQSWRRVVHCGVERALQRAQPHHFYQDANLICSRAVRGLVGHVFHKVQPKMCLNVVLRV